MRSLSTVHDVGQIVGVGVKDGYLLTLHLQRIGIPSRDKHVATVHGLLKDVYQRESLGDEVHGRQE